MIKMVRFLLAMLAAGGALLLTGCGTTDENMQEVPWSQPANWEGQMPGMPNTMR